MGRSNKSEEPAEFDAEEVHATEKARLFKLADSGEERWFPNSVIIDYDGMTLQIARWFAEKEKLV